MWEGWGGIGGGGVWEADGSSYHTLEQKEALEGQKQPQCTCQAKMVIDSSLTSSVALLAPPSGCAFPIVDCHKFTRS